MADDALAVVTVAPADHELLHKMGRWLWCGAKGQVGERGGAAPRDTLLPILTAGCSDPQACLE
jgi:hypothetical protein